MRLEDITATFFPKLSKDPLALEANQLVWVCISKGRKRQNLQVSTTKDDVEDDETTTTTTNLSSSSRMELFLRARVEAVVEDSRIRVQYPSGSTYHCRPEALLPVLESAQHKNLVIVASETPEYRRACVVHTLPGEDFLEIGCDFGITCHKVQQATGGNTNDLQQRHIWGIDKSPVSLDIARKRYPDIPFFLCDVLLEKWPTALQTAQPSVVAIDINGNRELPAVCACLEEVWKQFQPRLVIVKSRELYRQNEVAKQYPLGVTVSE